VDGKTVTELGTKVDPQRQTIALDGETLRMERKKYYALNKPPGVLSTNRDPRGRPRVIDLFPPGGPRLFTVGRLDEDSEGLLLVTNDGDLAQKLAHPRFHIPRRYELQVAGIPRPASLAELRKGLYFTEGRFRVKDAKVVKVRGQSAIVEAVLTEGHNRELRRLFARVGHKVMKLKRVAFGPVQLGRLPRGEHRELSRDELAELLEAVGQRGQVERPQREAARRKSSGRRAR
jgi:23S rRNA pseudouridine2605 synthase